MKKQANITLTLTDKEFEILRRAIVKYTSEQLHNSKSWGNPEAEEDDAAAIRARLAFDVQSKVFKKIEARPELNYTSIF